VNFKTQYKTEYNLLVDSGLLEPITEQQDHSIKKCFDYQNYILSLKESIKHIESKIKAYQKDLKTEKALIPF